MPRSVDQLIRLDTMPTAIRRPVRDVSFRDFRKNLGLIGGQIQDHDDPVHFPFRSSMLPPEESVVNNR